MTSIIWLLMENSITVIPVMDSVPHVECLDVVQCGAFVVIKNYVMDGLATISNSTSLLRNLNCKRTQQMTPIWNGFHVIVLMIKQIMQSSMAHPLVHLLN